MEGGEDEVALLLQLPPGFRFHPTDEEIIMHYLLNKVMDPRFRATAIAEADLNKCEPWDLPGAEKAKQSVVCEKERYLFFQRDRKYPTGMRTNRATESGYWKATGKDKEIKSSNKRHNNTKKNDGFVAGMKKTLVFYRGRAPRGVKTNWVMHEYRLNADAQFPNHMISRAAKEQFVVCRVFQKKSSSPPPGLMPQQLSTTTHDDDGSFLQLPPLLTDVDYSCRSNINNNINPSPPLSSNRNSQHDEPNFHPQLHLPTSMLTFSHQQQQQPIFGYESRGGFGYPTTNDRQNSREMLEHFSSSNSVISQSQETGLCTEYYQLANEITSLPSKGDVGESKIRRPFDERQLEEGLSFSPDISDLDSLWSY